MIDDSDLEEEYVPSDAYFHIAKKGMASHVTVLKMLQDLTSFPQFATLDRSAVLQEELEMTNLRAHKAKIRHLVKEATEKDTEELSIATHKGSVQKIKEVLEAQNLWAWQWRYEILANYIYGLTI